MKTIYLTEQLKQAIAAAMYCIDSTIRSTEEDLEKNPVPPTVDTLCRATLQDYSANRLYLSEIIKE